MPDSAETRLARAMASLDGLSVGDAFGERFFLHPHVAQLIIGERGLPEPPWRYTDDTQMRSQSSRRSARMARSTRPFWRNALASGMTPHAAMGLPCTAS